MGSKVALPEHELQPMRRIGERRRVVELCDGRIGEEVTRGVLDAEDGRFYPLPAEYPDTRPMVKLSVNGKLVYAPREAVVSFGCVVELR